MTFGSRSIYDILVLPNVSPTTQVPLLSLLFNLYHASAVFAYWITFIDCTGNFVNYSILVDLLTFYFEFEDNVSNFKMKATQSIYLFVVNSPPPRVQQ